MEITVLGSGTSSGVPTIGCHCHTCMSTDERDKRLRPSLWIKSEDRSFVVDTSSDFRQQCLREGIKVLDAVLYTHHHFDHIAGFDDLRAFNYLSGKKVPVFGSYETLNHIRSTFSYAFDPGDNQSSSPSVSVHTIVDETFFIDTIPILPIPLFHGTMQVNGYRIGDFAYCTDCNKIPETSLGKLANLDILILDALRHTSHPTHFSLNEAIEVAQRVGARSTYFTHIAHDIQHTETEAILPDNMYLAYDGLTLWA